MPFRCSGFPSVPQQPSALIGGGGIPKGPFYLLHVLQLGNIPVWRQHHFPSSSDIGGPADPIAPTIIISPRNTSVIAGTSEVILECVANAR